MDLDSLLSLIAERQVSADQADPSLVEDWYDFFGPLYQQSEGGTHESIDDLIDAYPIPTISWNDRYENWKEGWLEREEKFEMERPTKERELMSADALKDLFNITRPAIEEIYEYMGYEDTGEAFDSLLSKVGSGTILSYLTDKKDPALKSEYKDENMKKLGSAGRFNPAGGIIGKGKEGASEYIPLGSSFLDRAIEGPDTVFAGNMFQHIMPSMHQSEGYGVDFTGPIPRYGKSYKQHESNIMKENIRSLLHELRHVDPITGDILPHFWKGELTGLDFDYPLFGTPSMEALPFEKRGSKESDNLMRDFLSKLIDPAETLEELDIYKIYKELGY